MFERTWTVQFISGSGQAVVALDNLGIPGDIDEIELSAWRGGTSVFTWANTNDAPIIIFRDDVSLAEAQQHISGGNGIIDALLAVPASGNPVSIRVGDLRSLTVFHALTNSGAPSYVQIKIRAKPE